MRINDTMRWATALHDARPFDGRCRSQNPTTWNAYAYVNGDPVNFNDPTGLVTCGDLDVFGGGSVSDYMDACGSTGLLTRFVWAEGGTLSQNGGSQLAMGYAQMLIAQSIRKPPCRCERLSCGTRCQWEYLLGERWHV